jgi:hypothetical protein
VQNIRLFLQRPPVLPGFIIFKSADPVDEDFQKTTAAFRTVVHDLSFKTPNVSATLNCNLFKPKFAVARAKCEYAVLNVVTSMAVDLHEGRPIIK